MKILNIHGYHGSAQNAAYNALKETVNADISAPQIDYDKNDPEKVLDELRKIITDTKTDMLVGTSLGGFYAALLSAQSDLPVILINPCMLPFLHLPRLGYKEDITPFISMFGSLNLLNSENVSCIIGGKDDVIDTHDFTEKLFKNSRFRIIPEGLHSGFTLPLKEYFAEVINMQIF